MLKDVSSIEKKEGRTDQQMASRYAACPAQANAPASGAEIRTRADNVGG